MDTVLLTWRWRHSLEAAWSSSSMGWIFLNRVLLACPNERVTLLSFFSYNEQRIDSLAMATNNNNRLFLLWDRAKKWYICQRINTIMSIRQTHMLRTARNLCLSMPTILIIGIHVEKVNGSRSRNFILNCVIYTLLMICKKKAY